MSLPLLLLTAGASIGVGAVAVPAVGSALSKPITGQVVPTRITDLAGYLFASSGAGARGFGVSDITDALGVTVDGQDPDSGQSIGTVDNGPATSPTVSVPRTGGIQPGSGPTPVGAATNDQKRNLAVAAFGAGIVISAATFFLIRRIMRS